MLELIKSYEDRPAADIPAALVAITILASGEVRTSTVQVEPEHVLPILTAMRKTSEQLELYLHRALTCN